MTTSLDLTREAEAFLREHRGGFADTEAVSFFDGLC